MSKFSETELQADLYSGFCRFSGDMDCEDSSYNSTSEPELDSDPEDPERLLNEWLGELDSLTVVSTAM